MNFLYTVTIYPIELAYRAVFEFFAYCSGSFPLSLIGLSLLTTIIYIPIKKLAAGLHQRERLVSDVMAPQLAQIKAAHTGPEHQAAINRLYRRYSYHPFLALRSSFGLLIQVPFLIAAYNMIQSFAPLAGQTFWLIGDLSRPDSLLGPVNLLPLLMTAVNIAAIYSTPDFTRRDSLQALLVAGLFLVLLYASPAALLIYWTGNNLLTLMGNLLNRSELFKTASGRVKSAVQRLIVRANPADLLLSALTAFCLFIYFPVVTYLRNVNEFAFNGPNLLLGLLVPFLITFCAVYCLLFALGRILRKYSAARVTVGHVLLLSLLFAAIIEGAFLSLGLPQLTGEANLFASKPRLVLDSLVWLGLAGLAVVFWKKAAMRFSFLMGILLAATVIGLGDAWQGKEQKIPVTVTNRFVFDNMAFNKERNIIVIISDSFPLAVAQEIFQNNSELEKQFDGFTFFTNNLGPGGQTSYAIPEILHGKVYDGEDYSDFVNGAFKRPGTLPRFACDSGYNFYATGFPKFTALWDEKGWANSGAAPFTCNPSQIKQLLFRFMPYVAKIVLNEQLAIAEAQPVETPSSGRGTNKHIDDRMHSVFRHLTQAFIRHSTRPTVHFHYYNGLHAQPNPKDQNGNPLPKGEGSSYAGLLKSGEWEMHSFAAVLTALKDQGLYDSSTVVIMGDHGRFQYMQFPLFMVKPENSRGEMLYTQVPTSSATLPEMLNFITTNNDDLKNWLNLQPRVRKIFEQPAFYYVVTGGEGDTPVFEKHPLDISLNPTVLEFGYEYSLARMSNKPTSPLAVPVRHSENMYLSGGVGIDYRGGKEGLLAFQAESARATVEVFCDIWNYGGNIALNVRDLTSGNIVFAHDSINSRHFTAHLRPVMLNDDGEIQLAFDAKSSITISMIEMNPLDASPNINWLIEKQLISRLDQLHQLEPAEATAHLFFSQFNGDLKWQQSYFVPETDINKGDITNITKLLTSRHVLLLRTDRPNVKTVSGLMTAKILAREGLGTAYEPLGETFNLAKGMEAVIYRKARDFTANELDDFITDLPQPVTLSSDEKAALTGGVPR